MKKLVMLLVMLAGMVLVQGCDEWEGSVGHYSSKSGEYKRVKPELTAPEKAKVIPYEILFSYQPITDKYGQKIGTDLVELLVPSFSRQTPLIDLRRFCKSKGYSIVILYCTRSAYEANMSAKYSKAHPDAMRIGYLGMWSNGRFEESSY